jgi:hypothetical protein
LFSAKKTIQNESCFGCSLMPVRSSRRSHLGAGGFSGACLATNVATLAYKASERNSWTEQTHRVPLAVCNKPATPEVDTIAAYAALGQPHSTGNHRRAGRAAERYQRGRCASRRHY